MYYHGVLGDISNVTMYELNVKHSLPMIAEACTALIFKLDVCSVNE